MDIEPVKADCESEFSQLRSERPCGVLDMNGFPHRCRLIVTCLLGWVMLCALGRETHVLAQSPIDGILTGHEGAVVMAVFTPDGERVVTASADQTARVWDITKQIELRKYAQHTGPLYCLAVSGDGRTLVTGSQDNTVRVWDLPLLRPIRSFAEHTTSVRGIVLSPDGLSLLSVAADKNVRSHDLLLSQSGGRLPQPTIVRAGHASEVLAIATRSDGVSYCTADASGQILIWSPDLDLPQGRLLGHSGRVTSVAIPSNNQQLYTTGDDGVLRIWQLPTTLPKELATAAAVTVDLSLVPNQNIALWSQVDGTLRLVDLTTGMVTRELPPFAGQLVGQSVAPNAEWFATWGEEGSVQLSNIGDGRSRGRVVGHTGAVTDVAIHADNNRFATSGHDGSVRFWQQPPPPTGLGETQATEPQAPLRVWDGVPGGVNALAMTPDQQFILAAGGDGMIRQWNLSDGNLARTFQGPEKPLRKMALSANGQFIAATCEDQHLYLWNTNDVQPLRSIPHPQSLRSVSLTADGTRVVTSSADGVIRVWEAATGQLLEAFAEHVGPTITARILPDGVTVVSTGEDKRLRSARMSIIKAWPIHRGAVRDLVLYQGGAQTITTGNDGRVTMTEVSNGTAIRTFQAGEFQPTCLTLRPDGQRLAAGTEAGEVLVWNINAPDEPLQRLKIGAAVTALQWSPDQLKLVAATVEKLIHVFGPSPPNTQPQVELLPHQQIAVAGLVTDLQFAPENRSVWAALETGKIEEWAYAGPAATRQFNHGGPVYGVAVTRDGQTVVSASTDQTVRVWDVPTQQQKFQLNGHTGAVHAVTLSPDETFAISSGADGTLRLWDIVGGRQLKQLSRYEATMYAISIHPNGEWLAAAGADRKVHLLDIISGTEQRVLEGHTDYIHDVTFSPVGDRVLSYGYAGHLKYWNVADGSQLSEQRIGRVGNSARYSPDGKRLVLANGDGTARVILSGH